MKLNTCEDTELIPKSVMISGDPVCIVGDGGRCTQPNNQENPPEI